MLQKIYITIVPKTLKISFGQTVMLVGLMITKLICCVYQTCLTQSKDMEFCIFFKVTQSFQKVGIFMQKMILLSFIMDIKFQN